MACQTHAATEAVALQSAIPGKQNGLDCGAHARCIDEFFCVMIDLPSGASTVRVNVKLVPVNVGSRWGWQIDFVFYRLLMIGQLQVGPIDTVKFPNHSQEICLSTKQLSDDDSGALPQRRPSQMFEGEDSLRLDELLVKVREGQIRWQYCVLDVEKTVISRGQTARFSVPRFGAGVRRVDADVDNLWNFQTPIAYDLEAFAVP